MKVIERKHNKFIINPESIKPRFRQTDVINGLYAAVYEEFKGAIHNNKYSNMTVLERLQAVNSFAENWLKTKGFLNEN